MATTWTVEDLKVERLNDDSVIARWHFDTGTTTDYFGVWWEWWSEERKIWVLASDNAKRVPTSHFEQGWFQDTYNVPQQLDATWIRVYVRPWATKTDKGYYNWQSAGVYSKSIKSPYWEAHETEERKRRLAPPNAPVISSATPQGNTVLLEFSCDAEFANDMVIFRSDDWSTSWPRCTFVNITATKWIDRDVKVGHTYRYAMKSYLPNGTESEWSNTSDPVDMKPAAPQKLKATAVASDKVRLDWENVGRTGSYFTIEYSDDENAWSNNDEAAITKVRVDETSIQRYTISGLESGKRWYFRLWRGNDTGESAWAHSGLIDPITGREWIGRTIVSVLLGTTPDAPTTTTTPTAVAADSSVTFSWTHNSEDGSEQSAWELWLDVNGNVINLGTEWGQTPADASSYTTSMSAIQATDGATVSWWVRTKGVLNTWSPWSRKRTFRVWAKPVVEADITKVDGSAFPREGSAISVETFPFVVGGIGLGYTSGNAPIQWWAKIVANASIRSVDRAGEDIWIAKGQEIWRRTVNVGQHGAYKKSLDIQVEAQDILLTEGASYSLVVGCVTSQGMRGESQGTKFIPRFGASKVPRPFADFDFDDESLTCKIKPRCNIKGTSNLRPNTELSVYRINSDGTPELLADELNNNGKQYIIDTHPNFGRCRYRIVALDTSTGAQNASEGFADTNFDSICIQWGDSFRRISTGGVDGVRYTGERVLLPYNIKIDESYAPDVAFREYMGRNRPVAYYGTQKGMSASWSADLVRGEDTEDIEVLRELAGCMENAYVREPSGLGYWAHVDVSNITQTADSKKVSVTVQVTPVDHEEAAYG